MHKVEVALLDDCAHVSDEAAVVVRGPRIGEGIERASDHAEKPSKGGVARGHLDRAHDQAGDVLADGGQRRPVVGALHGRDQDDVVNLADPVQEVERPNSVAAVERMWRG